MPLVAIIHRNLGNRDGGEENYRWFSILLVLQWAAVSTSEASSRLYGQCKKECSPLTR